MAVLGDEHMVEDGGLAVGLGFALPLQDELGHAAQQAMSPPSDGRKKAVLVGRSLLVSISSGFCGCWKRSSPRS